MVWCCELDSPGLGFGSVVGCCELDNEPPAFIKCGKFLDELSY
jgi:hypothetical protein